MAARARGTSSANPPVRMLTIAVNELRTPALGFAITGASRRRRSAGELLVRFTGGRWVCQPGSLLDEADEALGVPASPGFLVAGLHVDDLGRDDVVRPDVEVDF